MIVFYRLTIRAVIKGCEFRLGKLRKYSGMPIGSPKGTAIKTHSPAHLMSVINALSDRGLQGESSTGSTPRVELFILCVAVPHRTSLASLHYKNCNRLKVWHLMICAGRTMICSTY